ncbi:MAG: DUF262 domain-containing protein [Polyangiales bacterium]
MAHFTANPVELKYLLAKIDHGKLALPDFQRDFVWDPGAIGDLLASLAQGFPAGSLLTIRRGDGSWLEEREFEGAPKLSKDSPPEELVLDGQQRLTSLYGALYASHSHRFFIDLERLAGEDADFGAAVQAVPREAPKGLDRVEAQAEGLMFPIERLLMGEFDDWIDEIAPHRRDEDASTLRRRLRDVSKRTLKNIEDYRFPVVSLPSETRPEAVCKIFSTINSTGVQLTTFDLLAARWWSESVRLRSEWKEARAKYPILETFFGDDGSPLLQIMALAEKGRCTDGAINDLTAASFHAHWRNAVDGARGTLELLRDECGVFSAKFLPYRPAVVGLAAVWPSIASATGPRGGELRERAKRWFWCGTMSRRYEASANSRLASDIKGLQLWLAGETPPTLVASFDFESSALRETVSGSAGLYRGVLALLLSRGPLDFHKRKPLTKERIEEGVDDHHVFPKQSPAARGVEVKLINSILNRALIDPETNRRISNRNPSVYLDEMRREWRGQEALDEVLVSHGLPAGKDSALLADDMHSFLSLRETEIAKRVESVTGWQPSARRAADKLVRQIANALDDIGCTSTEESDVDGDYSGREVTCVRGRFWVGRWDWARVSHSAGDWIWIQNFESPSKDWRDLVISLSGQEFEHDDGPIACVREPDATKIARAVATYAAG